MQVDLCRELRQCAMRRVSLAGAHCDEVMHHALKLLLEEWVGVIGVSGEGCTVYLALSRDEVVQHRDPNAAPDVAKKIAYSGDLAVLVAWHSDVVERTDWNEDERNADYLNYSETHHRFKAHAVMDAACMEESESSQCETGRDNDPWVEPAGQNSGDRHHESQRDGAG